MFCRSFKERGGIAALPTSPSRSTQWSGKSTRVPSVGRKGELNDYVIKWQGERLLQWQVRRKRFGREGEVGVDVEVGGRRAQEFKCAQEADQVRYEFGVAQPEFIRLLASRRNGQREKGEGRRGTEIGMALS